MALPPGCRAACVLLALLLALIGLSPPSLAQQIAYEYDALGRLIVVATPEGVAQYEYDAVGNILRITTRRYADVTGPVAILGMSPTKGVPGTRVRIFGKGFGPSPADNQVAFNGAATSVISATASSLSVTVPAGATTGPISVTAPQGAATSLVPFTVLQAFAVVPDQAGVGLGGILDFQATLGGIATDDVMWRVNGVVGGNTILGTITATGTYTVPSNPPPIEPILVEAVLSADPTVVATATVRVVGQAPALVAAAPVTVSPAGLGGALAFARPVTVGTTATLAASGPVSVTGGPVVTAVTPSTGHAADTVAVILRGANLQGASGIQFFQTNTGYPDSTLAASGVAASADGSTVTLTVTISPTASLGVRVLQVMTPQGRSSGFDLGTNRFMVVAP